MESLPEVSEHPSDDDIYRKFSELASSPLPQERGQFGNPYLRWTVLYASLVVIISTFPLWAWVAIPDATITAWILASIVVSFGVQWVLIAFNAVRNLNRLYWIPSPSTAATVAIAKNRKFRHVVIVPCYLDPLDVLHACIQSLAEQDEPQKLLVVVTFESRTPEVEAKAKSVLSAFKSSFGDFIVVVHVLDRKYEIPGGCSNKNFALREAYKYMSKHVEGFVSFKCTLTTCDTDSKFHPTYFRVLEAAYNAHNPTENGSLNMCVWQPPLFYNWNLDQRPFFNRVTCLMRSMMMLGGLISYNLNPMSIFSYPLELGFAAGFINPRYGVDDIIAKVRWMCDTNTAVPVKLLPVGVISGPTIGTTWWHEVEEWGRQIRRWIIGSSESFHYFVIHYRFRPLFSGVMWFFVFFSYYAVLLCSAGLFSLFTSLPLPYYGPYPTIFGVSLSWAPLCSMILQYLAFGVAFLIDVQARRQMGIVEHIGFFRNVFHWLISPVVLFIYSAIAFVSIVRFVFEGKALAKHDMASKDGFSVQTK